MIQAVLLDADGVIQNASPDFFHNLTSLVGEKGDQFAAEVFAAEGPSATGESDFKPALMEVLARWEVAEPIERVLDIWFQIDVIDGLFELIKKIQSRGVKVALATNQQAYRMNFMGVELGFDSRFDVSYYSCQVGYKKPQLEFFKHAAQELGLAPEACLFIDDKEENVAAAEQIGMQGRVFKFSNLETASEELWAVLEEYLPE